MTKKKEEKFPCIIEHTDYKAMEFTMEIRMQKRMEKILEEKEDD